MSGAQQQRPSGGAAGANWWSRREQLLKKHGLWWKYGQVPKQSEREKPVEAYLPGGSEYNG